MEGFECAALGSVTGFRVRVKFLNSSTLGLDYLESVALGRNVGVKFIGLYEKRTEQLDCRIQHSMPNRMEKKLGRFCWSQEYLDAERLLDKIVSFS